jgi:hypothetical protein
MLKKQYWIMSTDFESVAVEKHFAATFQQWKTSYLIGTGNGNWNSTEIQNVFCHDALLRNNVKNGI